MWVWLREDGGSRLSKSLGSMKRDEKLCSTSKKTKIQASGSKDKLDRRTKNKNSLILKKARLQTPSSSEDELDGHIFKNKTNSSRLKTSGSEDEFSRHKKKIFESCKININKLLWR